MRLPRGASTLLLRWPVTGLPDGGPLLSSPGVAGRLAGLASATTDLFPAFLSVLAADWSGLGGRGVKGDS